MKKKLSSRKLWLAIIGFVSAMCVVFGVEDIKIEQICALIGALGTLIAYIFAEGISDASGKASEKTDTPPSDLGQSSPNNEEK